MLLLVALVAIRARAATSLQLRGHVPSVEVLEDPGGHLRIEDVSRPETKFAARPGGLNVGYSPVVYWIRFELQNTAPVRRALFTEIFRAVDHLDFHEVRATGTRSVESGSLHPYPTREIAHDNFVFRSELEPGERVRVYARFQSADSLDLTPKLWTEPEIVERLRDEDMAQGLYYGLMLALILYNSFVFFATRAPAYGPYIAYQLCYTLLQGAFDRLTFRYLWPQSPVWALKSELVFGALALVFGAWFARSFLELPKNLPRLSRLVELIAAAAAVLAVVGAVSAHTLVQQTTLYFVTFALPLIIAVGAYAWARRVPNASYYTIAFLLFVAGTLVDVFATSGSVERSPVMALLPRIGAASEALLLAFGLANRLNVAQREQERATTELAESRRAYAETLEQRVAERTRDLEAAQLELGRKERLASLGRLVAGVAHEVMNPLNFGTGGAAKLRAELEKLRAGAGPDLEKSCATASEALGLVDASNQRIHAIVENLRAYAGAGGSEPVPTDLVRELESVVGLAQQELDAARVRLVKRLEPLPPCNARPGELGQVFVNLIVNACQAMPDGGTLTLSTGADDGRVWVRFADTGPGVPPELRDRIFEPFFTTRPPGQGTGLGLAISHEVVTRHGGDLRLVPSERGAVFELGLPRRAS